jgi:group I intron endonuclease
LYYIYIIHNLKTNGIYVGKTDKPKSRWKKHIVAAMGNDDSVKFYLQRSIKKHGVDSFTFTVIQEFLSEKECFAAESYWIKFYNSNNKKFGMNLTTGGEGISGYKFSDESKKKMRDKRLGFKHDPKVILEKICGENNGTAKLKEKEVLEIREKYSTMEYSQVELAREYGVNPTSIRHILNNRTWKHLGEYKYPGRVGKLTNDQAKEIRIKFESGASLASLSREYKVSRSTIHDIIVRKTRKNI